MKIVATGGYRSGGRLSGCYVYLLLCQERDLIFAKVGVSQDPIKRLTGILVGCPLIPGVLAVVELQNRQRAFRVEASIHSQLREWRSRGGEWFELRAGDKCTFNAALRSALDEFASPSWPLNWTKLNVPELLKQQHAAAWVVGHKKVAKERKGGNAFRDFHRHSLDTF